MVNTKTSKLVLDSQGSYLGMEKGCFLLRDKQGKEERYPLFEKQISEVVLKSGNAVSTGALASLGFWGIDVLVMTQRGRPVAMLKSLDDDSHVKTRLCQYEALTNGKGIQIAKQLVLSKIAGQEWLLNKYGLRIPNKNIPQKIKSLESDNLKNLRLRLTGLEGKFGDMYFEQIFKLFSEKIRPSRRHTYLAYDGLNNIFNLAYEMLSWKVHKALVGAKLEPFLGFLHSVQVGKPSLVCDFEELYRYLIDDFVILYCQDLKKRDFTVKTEKLTRRKMGKRQYLKDENTKELMGKLDEYFETKVNVARIKYGKRQTLETLINEEAFLFARYLRNELKQWIPRTLGLRETE